MYGFPTETEQETIDALERVRQLFAEGCIQSAFWHRFAATAHSPIGQRARALSASGCARRSRPAAVRAQRARRSTIPTGCDHEFLGQGLRKALYNYMHGLGLDADVRAWFRDAAAAVSRPRRIPRPAGAARSDPARALARALTDRSRISNGPGPRIGPGADTRRQRQRRRQRRSVARIRARTPRSRPRYGGESFRRKNPETHRSRWRVSAAFLGGPFLAPAGPPPSRQGDSHGNPRISRKAAATFPGAAASLFSSPPWWRPAPASAPGPSSARPTCRSSPSTTPPFT